MLRFLFQHFPQAEPQRVHLSGVFASGRLPAGSPGSAMTRLRVASRWRKNPSQASVAAALFSGT